MEVKSGKYLGWYGNYKLENGLQVYLDKNRRLIVTTEELSVENLEHGNVPMLWYWIDNKDDENDLRYGFETGDNNNLYLNSNHLDTNCENIIDSVKSCIDSNSSISEDKKQYLKKIFGMILGEMKPVEYTADELKRFQLQRENAEKDASIAELTSQLEEARRMIEEQKKQIEEQKQQIEGQEQQIASKDAKINEEQALINKLQSMVQKLLNFSERVRNSTVGKIFFKKDIKALSENTDDQR